MRNFEKYEEEIKAVGYNFAVVNGKIARCADEGCANCMFNGDESCDKKMLEWLYEDAYTADQPPCAHCRHRCREWKNFGQEIAVR